MTFSASDEPPRHPSGTADIADVAGSDAPFVTRVEPSERAQEGSAVVICVPDVAGNIEGARLWSDVALADDTTFQRVEQGWQLRLEQLPVDRLEYLVELTREGSTETIVDPTNPRRVDGAFGDHSWLALPAYREPAWLEANAVDGIRVDGHVEDTPVGRIDWQVWSPSDAQPDESLPLLLAHDGPEMDTLADLTRYVGAMIAAERLPRLRVALLSPGERDERYAANPAYSEALCEHVLPALLEAYPTLTPPAILGASLGAVAALHAAWQHPGTLGPLFLASGSFFTPALDPQERSYSRWAELTGFVEAIGSATAFPAAPGAIGDVVDVPNVAVVCGTAEENFANNESIAAQLNRLGVEVQWGTRRDGHCFICWRDLFDPHLTDLLGATLRG